MDKGTSPVYIQAITDKLNENQEKKTAPKTVSAHLDKIGFKEFREKDMHGSYLSITKEIYEIIVAPICPTLSSYSSYSSYLQENSKKLHDEPMTNTDEGKKTPMTNMMNNDENDEYNEVGNDETPPQNKKINFQDLGVV